MLGPLEATVDGVPVPLGGPKQRVVLATLLLDANHVVSVDRLVDVVWGEEAHDGATSTLQVYVSNLRKALGPDEVILTQRPGYLVRADPAQLDLLEFEDRVGRARIATEAGDSALAAEEYSAALALWRGRPLSDLADDTRLDAELARLTSARHAVVTERIDADLARGDHASVTAELEALVRDHPLDERLRLQLMLALYRAGRQAEALAVYADARQVLVEELGIEPGPQLRELEGRVLAQDPTLLDPSTFGVDRDSTTATRRREPVVAAGRLALDGRQHDLDRAVTTIGRASDRAIVVDDPEVSRRHAEIRRAGDRYVLADNGSTNGTRVNGEVVTQVELQDGDEIGVGSAVLRFATIEPA